MRGRTTVAAAVVAAAPLAACSLLVSTSGLEGDADKAPAPDASDDGRTPGSGEGGEDAAPRDPNLVGAWSFEEQSGRVALDASGLAHDAVLGSAVTWTAAGARGGGVHFDGSSDTVLVPTLGGASFPTTGTLSVWFRYAFPPNDPSNRAIFDNWDDDRGHIFFRRANGAADYVFQAALQPSNASTVGYSQHHNFEVQPSTWVHFVVTWDAGERAAAFYVDGKLLHRAAYRSDFQPDGQRFALGERFLGELDEVRLYDRALVEAEVAALP